MKLTADEVAIINRGLIHGVGWVASTCGWDGTKETIYEWWERIEPEMNPTHLTLRYLFEALGIIDELACNVSAR